jgi:hypothetical protein
MAFGRVVAFGGICTAGLGCGLAMFGFGAIVKMENRMRSGVANEGKSKLQKVKGKSKTASGKLKDPTLEGKDENKIGRIQKES